MNHNLLSDTADYAPVPSPGPMRTPTPSNLSVQVDLAARTHPGKLRPNNEDNFLVIRFGRFLETMFTSVPDDQMPKDYRNVGYGMVVADGMGGMAAGEIASRMAINLLVNLVLDTPDWILELDEPHVSEVIDRTARRFMDVNQAIIEQAESQSGLKGMGTTLTMACSLGMDVIIAHVGDSPIYLARQGELHKLTRDHTLAEDLARRGSSPATAIPTRYRHVLTHAIGIAGTGGDPDIDRLHLDDGDRLLLCTDGLTGMVDDATIAAELQRDRSADETCQALVDRALEGGGKDNVTVVVAGYRMRS
jgi:PPM family protein phosphatase